MPDRSKSRPRDPNQQLRRFPDGFEKDLEGWRGTGGGSNAEKAVADRNQGCGEALGQEEAVIAQPVLRSCGHSGDTMFDNGWPSTEQVLKQTLATRRDLVRLRDELPQRLAGWKEDLFSEFQERLDRERKRSPSE